MALSNGAALVWLGRRLECRQAANIARRATDHACQLPPAVLATLTRSRGLALECLVVAGESCPAALITEWCDDVRMINALRSPTEGHCVRNNECATD